MSTDQLEFLKSDSFAVAGASNNRQKYGNIVFRALSEYFAGDVGRSVYPVHPTLDEVETVPAFKSVKDLPTPVEALSIVTPPQATRRVVQDAIESGIKKIWMQPGAEDDQAIEAAEAAGVVVIAGGPCILVAMKTIAQSSSCGVGSGASATPTHHRKQMQKWWVGAA